MDRPFVKLLAADLLALAVRPSRLPPFFRRSMAVFRAETLGVVVVRDRTDKFLRFLVDDGTGCVPCILWLNHHHNRRRRRPSSSSSSSGDLDLLAMAAGRHAALVEIGKLVRVRGRITFYNGEIQITVADVVAERDPNTEILHWLQCIKLAKHCYDLH